MPSNVGNIDSRESASNHYEAGNLDAIASLTERELFGWWWAVVVEKIRPERPGERAALIRHAKALGADLGGWQSIGGIAARMVRNHG